MAFSSIDAHIAIDFVPLYPVKLPSWATTLYDYYRTNYNDPLYAKDPPFFRVYVFIEAVYLVPTCIWAIRPLIQVTFRLTGWRNLIRAANGP